MSTYTRRIKVHQARCDYKPKNAGPYWVTPSVPWIQLKGKWLAKAGFNIGAPVTVQVSEGRLVLTAE